MRFLHLIKPVMGLLPEVAQPNRKVRSLLGILVARRLTFSQYLAIRVSNFVYLRHCF